MRQARQLFPPNPAFDVERTVSEVLRGPASRLGPGARVAVAVGSRGIANIDTIVVEVIRSLKALGAKPFILPAMGSHGGATPEGQTALLGEFGLTATRLGVPVHAAMETETVGTSDTGLFALTSVEALRADAVLLVARVKPHTDFSGTVGSGLLKMLVVGLGKRAGAVNFHRAAARFGHEVVLRRLAQVLLTRLPLLGGLAILENQRHATARIEFVAPRDFASRDEALCALAATMMPTLPFATIDLLIVDRMGKNVSGTGMDPAVIGRTVHGYSLLEGEAQSPPRVRRLFVRDLTPESRGNAIGIGLADFTTSRLVRAMNPRTTALNALTALSLQAAKVPIHFETDRDAIVQALSTLPAQETRSACVVRIRDTLSVEHLEISEDGLRRPEAAGCLVALGEPRPMQFDAFGNLV